MWFVAGKVVESYAPEPVGEPVGKVLQLEAGIAGPRLHKVLKKTPLYPYIMIAESQVGWIADVGMLVAAPLAVGFAAMNPGAARAMKPLMVGLLVPVLAEIAKNSGQQAALLESLETYDRETIELASRIIDDIVGPEPTSNKKSPEEQTTSEHQ